MVANGVVVDIKTGKPVEKPAEDKEKQAEAPKSTKKDKK